MQRRRVRYRSYLRDTNEWASLSPYVFSCLLGALSHTSGPFESKHELMSLMSHAQHRQEFVKAFLPRGTSHSKDKDAASAFPVRKRVASSGVGLLSQVLQHLVSPPCYQQTEFIEMTESADTSHHLASIQGPGKVL